MGRPLKTAKFVGSWPTTSSVDTGFENPDGTANATPASTASYGVVGGATSLTGNQVLPRVSIGKKVSGTGTFYWNSGTAVVSYTGSDLNLTDYIGSGSWVGVDDDTTLGVETSVKGLISVTTSASTGGTSDIITVDDTTNLVANGAIVFGAAIGGLTAGTVYYVKTVVDGTTFTVSLTPGGAKLDLTATTVTTTATQNTVTLTSAPSSTGQSTSISVATNGAGYIIRQKGKRKYLVADATTIQDEDIKAGYAYRIISAAGTNWTLFGADATATAGDIFTATVNGNSVAVENGTVNLVGICKTANLANAALTGNTMNLIGTDSGSTALKLDSMTNYFATDYTDNGTDENSGTKYIVTFGSAVAANSTLGYPNGILTVQKG